MYMYTPREDVGSVQEIRNHATKVNWPTTWLLYSTFNFRVSMRLNQTIINFGGVVIDDPQLWSLVFSACMYTSYVPVHVFLDILSIGGTVHGSTGHEWPTNLQMLSFLLEICMKFAWYGTFPLENAASLSNILYRRRVGCRKSEWFGDYLEGCVPLFFAWYTMDSRE